MKIKDLDPILSKLLQDPIFAESEKYSELLKFLAECSRKQFVPSETDLSEHFQGKNHKFDPTSDASIRILIFKLRKKIDEYYSTRGKRDKVRLTIPKRKYTLELVEESEIKNAVKHNAATLLYALIIILSAALIWLFIEYHALKTTVSENNPERSNNFIFRDFVNSKIPTILAIGSIYTFTEYQDEINSFRIIRNQLINSDDDLSLYKQHNNIPNEKISKPTWNMVPENTIKYYNLIQSIFTPSNFTSLNFRLSSQVAWSELPDNNLIFIGHFHNLGNLAQVYRSQHFYSPSQNTNYSKLVSILEKNLNSKKISDKNSIQNSIDSQIDMLFTISNRDSSNDALHNTYKFSFNEKTNYVHDYVVLSKLPGPNSNPLLFIISFHLIGRLKVVNMITDPLQMRKFEEKVRSLSPSIPKYFEMLIEVKGYKDTAMELNILHFYEGREKYSID